MNRSAFTLVELMISVAIVSVIAAGTLMFFSGSGRMSREAYLEVSSVMSNRVDRERRLFVPVRAGGNVDLPGDGVWRKEAANR